MQNASASSQLLLRSRTVEKFLSATNTRYGLLAIGTDPRDWEFCENKSNNWFASIEQADFESGIDNWKPVSVDALTVSLQPTARTESNTLVETGCVCSFRCVSYFLCVYCSLMAETST